jgi:hypothetical protein
MRPDADTPVPRFVTIPDQDPNLNLFYLRVSAPP